MRKSRALLLFAMLAFTLFLTVLASQPVEAVKVKQITAAACIYNCGSWQNNGCCPKSGGGYTQRQSRFCTSDPGGLVGCSASRCTTANCNT